jgi:outer membrane translocation and assembly module TamA
LPILGLTAAVTLYCAPAAHAQLPERVERCLPYPTYAQEVDAMFSKPKPAEAVDTTPDKTFVIDSVEFDGPITLPEPARKKLVHDLKTMEFLGTPDRPELDEIAEVNVRGAWQDEGYFKVSDAVTAKDLGGDEFRRHIALIVHVDEGLRYTLGKLAFRSSDADEPLAFTEPELRKEIDLKEGDIFDADKIRESLDAYRKLYASRGYIDFSSEPDFDVDDATKRISLTLVLDQQKQFHVGDVVVDGLDAKTESNLRSTIGPGDVFRYEAVEKFIDENKSALPPDASLRDFKLTLKNVKDGTVSMHFDFFTCPDRRN